MNASSDSISNLTVLLDVHHEISKAQVTCPLEAVNAHKADDHHAKDEEVRKEGVATLILFFIFTS